MHAPTTANHYHNMQHHEYGRVNAESFDQISSPDKADVQQCVTICNSQFDSIINDNYKLLEKRFTFIYRVYPFRSQKVRVQM